jgi:hypothetical protein
MNKVDYMKSGYKKVAIKNKTITKLNSGAVIPSWSAMERRIKQIR